MAPTEPSAPCRPAPPTRPVPGGPSGPRFRGSVPPRRFRGNVLAPLALAALLSGCDLVPEPAPDYLVDSGYRVAIDYVYWLDAHRILFVGSPVDEPYPPPYRSAITIWDTRTDEFEVYKRVSGLTRLCYADGWISYLPDRLRVPRSEGTRRLHWGGPMGEEEWLNPESKPGHLLHWNRHSCRFQRLKIDEDGFIRGHPLRIGDGRLLMSDHKEVNGGPVRWLDDEGRFGQELDLVSSIRPIYFPHLRGYFLPSKISSPETFDEWKRSGCLRFTLLRVEQNRVHTEKRCVPWTGLYTYGRTRIAPTRHGFLVIGKPYERRSAPLAGYYVHDKGMLKLFDGPLGSRAKVSFDGCKVALWPKEGRRAPITLQYVDTCKLMEELEDGENNA